MQARRRIAKAVPTIRLSGAWLTRHGFHTGLTYHLAVQDGQIVLTPASNPEPTNAIP
jgi:hypothetical protein